MYTLNTAFLIDTSSILDVLLTSLLRLKTTKKAQNVLTFIYYVEEFDSL